MPRLHLSPHRVTETKKVNLGKQDEKNEKTQDIKIIRLNKYGEVKSNYTLEELIEDAENVIIMGHQNGDIDSIGSSLGLYRFAKTIKTSPFIDINESSGLIKWHHNFNIPPKYDFEQNDHLTIIHNTQLC